ncbi:hypothetical protein Acr_00g0066340 [Actinidia rufa]|uniref:Uncharacterized protein n=1 Tax=Actinidia rufa TaxID=165716 RepID=A0A7J0DQ28_9ERIC|nr:hypothetical protein Acr_00g0066340 [Actinidia rufa]
MTLGTPISSTASAAQRWKVSVTMQSGRRWRRRSVRGSPRAGICEGRRRHVDGGDGAEGFAGVKLEGVEVDVEAGLLVAIDGFVEDDGVVWKSDDGGSDAVGCEESGEIYHWDQVAAAHEWEEEHFDFASLGVHERERKMFRLSNLQEHQQ